MLFFNRQSYKLVIFLQIFFFAISFFLYYFAARTNKEPQKQKNMLDFYLNFDNPINDNDGVWIWDGEKWIYQSKKKDIPEEDW